MNGRINFHTHSIFSFDSNTPIENMVREYLKYRYTAIGFSEHNDFDPSLDEYMYLDIEKYFATIENLKKKYPIELYKGVEIDFQERFKTEIYNYINSYSFDYIIGSVHYIDSRAIDLPNFKEFFYNLNEEDRRKIIKKYISENIKMLDTILIDIIGHIDLIKLYVNFNLDDFIYDYEALLKKVIEKEVILEVNISAIRKGKNEPYPSYKLLNLYRELGGELITVSEDSHKVSDIFIHREEVEKKLRYLGFKKVFFPDKREVIL